MVEGNCPFPVDGERLRCTHNDCVMYNRNEDMCAFVAHFWRFDNILKQLTEMTNILQKIAEK